MGCMHSSESLVIDAEEESEPTSDPPEPSKRKENKNLKQDSNNPPEKKPMELKPPTEQSEGLTIHVIWRRVSIFGGRRDSQKSTKSLEAELPGPSEISSPVSQAMSSKT